MALILTLIGRVAEIKTIGLTILLIQCLHPGLLCLRIPFFQIDRYVQNHPYIVGHADAPVVSGGCQYTAVATDRQLPVTGSGNFVRL